jgi:hypothetical protein
VVILFFDIEFFKYFFRVLHEASSSWLKFCRSIHLYVCSFKFLLKVGVEESIVNAPRITDHGFKFNLTFCVVCGFTVHTDEWCVHNRFFNASFEEKFK